MLKIFAVYLGGKARRANIELHDVVFVTGASIEDTYEQLLDKWFGAAEGLHIDSWVELDIVDGHRVVLADMNTNSDKRLYFLNLGAYLPGQFLEVHSNLFMVAQSEKEAISRARSEMSKTPHLSAVHTDYLYDVDECLEVSEVNGMRVMLSPTLEEKIVKPHNRYHIIPKPIVTAYLMRNPSRSLGRG